MKTQLSLELNFDLARLNPWWKGDAMRNLPETRRHLVFQIKKRFEYKIAPIIVVRGSRQIGKTTACEQIISDFLSEGIEPERIFRVQFDEVKAIKNKDYSEPILRLVEWYEQNILKTTLNESARNGKQAYIFLDEVQNLDTWAEQLKFLVDTTSVQVLVTGSSALRIERGRDSLAGRINTIEASVLSLTEIGALRKMNPPKPYLPDNGISILKDIEFWLGLRDYGIVNKEFRDKAFGFFCERGAYPLVHLRAEAPFSLLADQLNETIVKRVIQHDLRVGDKGRKRDETLLEELFRYCCRFAGQAPSIVKISNELRTILNGQFGHQQVRHYFKFLSDTLLIRLIRPLEIRLKKQGSNLKICLVDHALRASWLQENIDLLNPKNEAEAVIAGYLAESTVGTVLSSISNLDTAWLPEKNKKQKEVDFILNVGDKRIPIEVKYRNKFDFKDIIGLVDFMDNPLNEAPFGIVVTKNDDISFKDNRIICIPLSSFMLLR